MDNLQSRKVVEKRIKREGIVRQHMIIKGEFVDLAMYSILKSECVGEKQKNISATFSADVLLSAWLICC